MGWFNIEQPLPTSTRAVLTTLWSVVIMSGVITMLRYYRARHTAVIVHRSPRTMLWAVSLFGFNQLINQAIGVVWYPPINCDGSSPMYFFTQAAFLAFWVMVLWRLLHLIVLNEAQRIRAALKLVDEGFDPPFRYDDLSWFQRRGLYYLTSRWVVLTLVITSILPPLVRVVWYPLEIDQSTCVFDDYAMSVVQLVVSLLMVLCAFRVRTITDGFYIVRELKWMGILALGHGILYGIIQGVNREFVFSAAGQVYLTLVLMTAIYITFVIPVQLTQHWESTVSNKKGGGGKGLVGSGIAAAANHHPGDAVVDTSLATTTAGAGGGAGEGGIEMVVPLEFQSLTGVLACRPARRAFVNHLIQEFSIEGLTFVDEIDQFTSLELTEISLVEANTKATAIYHKFIAPGAPFEINISHPCSSAIHAVFQPKSPTAASAAGGGGGGGSGAGISAAATFLSRRKYLFKAGNSMSSLARHANVHLAGRGASSGGGGGGGGAGPNASADPPSKNTRSVKAAATGASAAAAGAQSVAIGGLTASPLQTVAEAKQARAAAREAEREEAASAPMTFGGRDRNAHFYLHVFDAAREEIFNLLSNDSFARFQRSELFDTLLRNTTLANEFRNHHHSLAAAAASSTAAQQQLTIHASSNPMALGSPGAMIPPSPQNRLLPTAAGADTSSLSANRRQQLASTKSAPAATLQTTEAVFGVPDTVQLSAAPASAAPASAASAASTSDGKSVPLTTPTLSAVSSAVTASPATVNSQPYLLPATTAVLSRQSLSANSNSGAPPLPPAAGGATAVVRESPPGRLAPIRRFRPSNTQPAASSAGVGVAPAVTAAETGGTATATTVSPTVAIPIQTTTPSLSSSS